MKKLKRCTFALFLTVAFASISFAGDLGAVYSKDWTPEQIRAFVNKPWSDAEKAKMGGSDMGYILDKKSFYWKNLPAI